MPLVLRRRFATQETQLLQVLPFSWQLDCMVEIQVVRPRPCNSCRQMRSRMGVGVCKLPCWMAPDDWVNICQYDVSPSAIFLYAVFATLQAAFRDHDEM